MKANQVIDKMVEIRDNNALNADQTKYVKQVIEDFTEMGSMFESDEDSMNEVKKFIAKFPSKPQGTPSKARGEATMAKLRDKLSARTQANKPGANPKLDTSRYVSPKKKSLEIEGIILDKGDEIKDKSSGKTIIFDSFENRPEGIYILGSLKGEGHTVEVHRDNAHSPKKSQPSKPKASKGTSAVAEAKAVVAETKAEVKKDVAQAEKKAEKLIETAEKQAEQGKPAEANKTVAKAKEVVQDAVVKGTDETKKAEKALAQAQKAIDKKAKDEKKGAEKKEKAIKKGAYLDLGKEIIRIDSVEDKDGKKVISGTTRLGKSFTKTCSVDDCKITDYKAFNFQEEDFKGKNVPDLSEEVRIITAFLELQDSPTKKGAENLLIRINQFAAEYNASNKKGSNPYRDEINSISAELVEYVKGNKAKMWIASDDKYMAVVEKSEAERIYESVRIVKYFATWAKRTVTAQNITDLENRITLALGRKTIKPSNPLYKEVMEIKNKILPSMKGGGSFTFPELGLGATELGLAGTKKMIRAWAKDAEKRAKGIVKSATKPQPRATKANAPEKKGFFARMFGK